MWIHGDWNDLGKRGQGVSGNLPGLHIGKKGWWDSATESEHVVLYHL